MKKTTVGNYGDRHGDDSVGWASRLETIVIPREELIVLTASSRPSRQQRRNPSGGGYRWSGRGFGESSDAMSVYSCGPADRCRSSRTSGRPAAGVTIFDWVPVAQAYRGAWEMKKLLMTFCCFSLLLSATAAETFLFGPKSNSERAEVSVIDGCYHVVCIIKDNGNNGRNRDSLDRLKAQKLCLLGIASYRQGRKVSRCSATVSGMSLKNKPERNGGELFFVFTVPVDGFVEKSVQPVR